MLENVHLLQGGKPALRAQTGFAAVRHANLDLSGLGATNRMTVPSPKRSLIWRASRPTLHLRDLKVGFPKADTQRLQAARSDAASRLNGSEAQIATFAKSGLRRAIGIKSSAVPHEMRSLADLCNKIYGPRSAERDLDETALAVMALLAGVTR